MFVQFSVGYPVNLRQSGQVTWALLTGLWITPNRLT